MSQHTTACFTPSASPHRSSYQAEPDIPSQALIRSCAKLSTPRARFTHPPRNQLPSCRRPLDASLDANLQLDIIHARYRAAHRRRKQISYGSHPWSRHLVVAQATEQDQLEPGLASGHASPQANQRPEAREARSADKAQRYTANSTER
jgi:hypothetical protein